MKTLWMTRIVAAVVLTCTVVVVSGCTPLWVAGGAAAGYGVAKDAEDGKIIDD